MAPDGKKQSDGPLSTLQMIECKGTAGEWAGGQARHEFTCPLNLCHRLFWLLFSGSSEHGHATRLRQRRNLGKWC